jgi:hypothetical protein
MPAKKSTAQYELEATWVNGCLIHPAYRRLSRILYQRRHGALPTYIYVCHKCDNPNCILDAHHFLGTAKDNRQDALSKGRLVRSAESRVKTSVSGKLRFKKKSERVKMSVAMRTAHTPEVAKNKSNGQKRRYERANEIETMRRVTKQAWDASPARHTKVSKALVRYCLDPDVRAKKSKDTKCWQAAKTPEERSANALKAWVTRRKNSILKKGSK